MMEMRAPVGGSVQASVAEQPESAGMKMITAVVDGGGEITRQKNAVQVDVDVVVAIESVPFARRVGWSGRDVQAALAAV